MPGKPAARLSDSTTCPVPGHGVTPIQTGSPNVQFNNLPAARLGDTAGCGQAVSGAFSASVFINGQNAATLGSTLSHGGVIISGSGDVLIGDTVVTAAFSAPAPLAINRWISFQIPATERYTGWQCTAHFDDGTSLTSNFDSDNKVLFSNPSGSICTRLELPVPAETEQPSVTEQLLSMITGGHEQ
ncbi:PAAR domain-containing protein [Pseudomonas sp. GOM7]|uniref:PAAR domain-containing protein n=1 Tax=unclassified Pseudomonas TaxID=196821 RepID=UPI00227C9368|nr:MULTISPECIES: PAAR domain-containing protein [unclassified Pseudomonas]WAJ38200.1 PAAR domain-containing protein [Pseudomonas sp. GOM7]